MKTTDICKLILLLALVVFESAIIFCNLHSRVAQGIVLGDASLFVLLFAYDFISKKYIGE